MIQLILDMAPSAHTKRTYVDLPEEEGAPTEQNTIVIENEALRKGFTVVPNYILSDTNVSFGARLTYMLLLSYAWKEGSCFPGQDKLADDLGVTRKAVNKYLSELKDSEYVSWKRRGLGRTNVYYILNRPTSPTPTNMQEKPFIAPPKDSFPDVTTWLHQDVTVDSHQKVTKRLHNKDTEDKDSKEQQHAVVEKLRAFGVSHKMVQELIGVYKPETIQEKIDLLEWRSRKGSAAIQDKAAWIIKAIIDDYALPTAFIDAKRKQEQNTKRRQELNDQRKKIDSTSQLESRDEEKETQNRLLSLMNQYSTTNQEKQIWAKTKRHLESLSDTASYKLWLTHLQLLRLNQGVAIIYAQNTVVQKQIETRFTQTLSQALSMAIGDDQDMQIVVVTPTK